MEQPTSKKIGVLALQGAFVEHEQVLQALGAETVQVRLPDQLDGLDGLIIPGGESTTIGKLAVQYGLIDPLQQFASQKPVWGTCAGLIFLAKDIGLDQPILGLMDVTVDRNAFGRQVDSFEVNLDVESIDDETPFNAVFIRAPLVTSIDSDDVQVIGRLIDGRIVAVRQGRLLGTAFHPELTDDTRFHRFFLDMVAEAEAI